MLTPEFEKVWANFPDHEDFPTMGTLYRSVGGGAAAAIAWNGFGETGNTCASRVSIALNNAGYPIDISLTARRGLKTLKTSDGSHILFRVSELRTYLIEAYGAPDIDETPPFGDQHIGQPGIVAFTVQGWRDASGHVALYNGTSFREADHDDVPIVYPEVTVVRTEFWKLR